MDDEYLNDLELAEYWGLNGTETAIKKRFQRLRASKKHPLPSKKIGNEVRYRKKDVEEWWERGMRLKIDKLKKSKLTLADFVNEVFKEQIRIGILDESEYDDVLRFLKRIPPLKISSLQ